MAYTVTKLISNAYYKSGIVGREFETVSGSQRQVGLDEFNKTLSNKAVTAYLIPYYERTTFTGVVGQESYTIPDLVEVSTLTFTIGSVRYPVSMIGRDEYFGTSRANNVNSLPYTAHFVPALSGGSIYLYFKPDDTYVFELWGRFRLGQFALNDDLELTFDMFYIDFLEHILAARLCNEFNFDVPIGLQQSLTQLYKQFKNSVDPIDTNIRKVSTLQRGQGPDIYGDANIGRGWRPPT